MTSSRQWTLDDLDDAHPLPDEWEWIENGKSPTGTQLFAAAVLDHDYGEPEVESIVYIDDDGNLRFDSLCDSAPPDVCLAVILANKAPDASTPSAVEMPDLPPGYEVAFMDDFDDEKFNGWHILIDGEYYERPGDDPSPQERADAVDECWGMWLSSLSPVWREFFDAFIESEAQP